MRRSSGVTMTDVLLIMLVIALAVVPAAGVLTYTRISIKKTRQQETALFLAQQELNKLRATYPLPAYPLGGSVPTPPPTTQTIVIDQVPYDISVEFQPQPAGATRSEMQPDLTTKEVCLLCDVAVTASYPEGRPVTLSTRLFKDTVDMQSE